MNLNDSAESRIKNETLLKEFQNGSIPAVERLFSQNKGFLSGMAVNISKKYQLADFEEDLKQEGAAALMEAAKRFDPAYGTKFLTYAFHLVETAMLEFAARNASPVSMPFQRYRSLRRVSFLCSEAENIPDDTLLKTIQEELAVSEKTAQALLMEYRMIFHVASLEENSNAVSFSGDPAREFDISIRHTLLRKLMEDVLKPRECKLIQFHLGIDQPNEQQTSFTELAYRLNYNDPSGAEKAYKKAMECQHFFRQLF